MSRKKQSFKHPPEQQHQFYFQQANTPRTKKSVSINETSSKYMQLQLEVSLRKKEGMQKILAQRQKRISQLQDQIKENQSLVAQTIQKWRLREQQAKKQRQIHLSLKKQFDQLLSKYKKLKQKFSNDSEKQTQNFQLLKQNARLKQENQLLKKQRDEVKQKFRELKIVRKKEKDQWRSILPQFIEEFNKVKTEFLKIQQSKLSRQ